MRRVLIIGCGGAGKSRLARLIAERTGLPLFHLDRLYWKPGWQETSKDDWPQVVAQIVAQERWIVDGNYTSTLRQRLAVADTVILLDRSRCVCLWRMFRRWLQYRAGHRPDMTEGCPERLNWEFVCWIWNFSTTQRPNLIRQCSALRPEQRLVVLQSDHEVEAFLSGLARS